MKVTISNVLCSISKHFRVSRKLCKGFNSIIVVGNGQEKFKVEENLRAQASKHRFRAVLAGFGALGLR